MTTLCYILLSWMLILESTSAVSSAPSRRNSARKGFILSKEGKFLTIMKTRVTGLDSSNEYSEVEIHSVGMNGEVTIRGVKANKYLAIDSNGKIRLRKKKKADIYFIEMFFSGNLPYRSYQSKINQRHYLAITSQGLVTSRKKNSNEIQFAMI